MHDPNYPPHPGYAMPPQGYGAPPYDDRGAPPPQRPQDNVSLKRLRSNEFHPAVPPPPQNGEPYNPSSEGRLPAEPGRRGSAGGGSQAYEYPDPTSLAPVSPASSVQSYPPAPYPPQGQPYYPQHPPQQQPPQQAHTPQQSQGQPPPRRASPTQSSAYSYDARGSGSPHGSTSSASTYQQYPPQGLHPPQVLPPNNDTRTPPPAGRNGEGNGNGSAQRGGMAVRDLLGPGQNQDQGSRFKADSSMVNALNKKM
ncbi:MAG: hypothetical protein Q9164_000587 [Protoblastenia rupestris]